MDEIKTLKAKLKGFGINKKGKKEDGTDWVLYEYTLEADGKEKIMRGFINAIDLIGEEVEISYTETENPQGPYPFKNIKSIEKAETIKEANQKYNMQEIKKESENSMFFGMIFNKTIDWIMNEKKILESSNDKINYSLDENFEKIFEHLWEKAIKKRKEKLGF